MITVRCEAPTSKASEAEADQIIERFERELSARPLGGPLDRHERAIIKTFLRWALWGWGLKEEAAQQSVDDPGGQVGLRF